MRSRSFLFAALFALTPIAVLSATMASCSDEPPPPPRDSGPDTHPDYYVPPVEGGVKCDAGESMCNGMCVNVMGSDPMNCGNCNKACPMGATCSMGRCSTEPAVYAAGGRASFVALFDGTLYAWGSDESGEIGEDPNSLISQCMNVSCRYQPAIFQGVMNVVSVAAGWDHACAVQGDGKLFCWGSNTEGQLGHNPSMDKLCGVLPDGGMIPDAGMAPTVCNWVPMQVTLPSKAVQVVAGKGFTCARLDTKDVYCWGTNTSSITGRAAAGFDFNPNKISVFNADVTDIAVAGPTQVSHACAVRADGNMWCWGKNDFGQLGVAMPATSEAPLQVMGIQQVAVMALAEGTSCAQRQNGDPLCWGSHARGGLGNATPVDTNPHPMPGSPNAKWGATQPGGLFAGMATHFAKDTAGNFYVWGVNLFGTFGDGTNMAGMCGNDVCDPNTKISTKLLGYRSMITSDHALGITAGGKLASWGRNDYGQLGKQPGGTDSSCMGGIFCNPTPTVVQGLP